MRDIKKEAYDKFIEDSGILDWVGADENIIKHVYYEAFKDGEDSILKEYQVEIQEAK